MLFFYLGWNVIEVEWTVDGTVGIDNNRFPFRKSKSGTDDTGVGFEFAGKFFE